MAAYSEDALKICEDNKIKTNKTKEIMDNLEQCINQLAQNG